LADDERLALLQELLAGYVAGGAEKIGAVLEAWLLDRAGRDWLESC